MTSGVPTTGGRATREEHRAYMREAERAVLEAGGTPVVAARTLAAAVGVSPRQAFRYVKAVRARFAHDLEHAPLPSLEETITSLLAKSVACVQGDEPDWKASVKCVELACRLRGWLDKRSTVTVDGSVQVTHALTHKIEQLSTEQRLALSAYQDATERARLGGVVDSVATPTLPDTRVAGEPARPAVVDVAFADGK